MRHIDNLLGGSVSVEGVLLLKYPDKTGAFSGLNGHAGLLGGKGKILVQNLTMQSPALNGAGAGFPGEIRSHDAR